MSSKAQGYLQREWQPNMVTRNKKNATLNRLSDEPAQSFRTQTQAQHAEMSRSMDAARSLSKQPSQMLPCNAADDIIQNRVAREPRWPHALVSRRPRQRQKSRIYYGLDD
jgi:hypothetical protein